MSEIKLMSFDEPPLAVSALYISKRLCVSEDTILRAARRGEIPSFMVGSQRRFSMAVVNELLERRQPQPLAYRQTKKSKK